MGLRIHFCSFQNMEVSGTKIHAGRRPYKDIFRCHKGFLTHTQAMLRNSRFLLEEVFSALFPKHGKGGWVFFFLKHAFKAIVSVKKKKIKAKLLRNNVPKNK